MLPAASWLPAAKRGRGLLQRRGWGAEPPPPVGPAAGAGFRAVALAGAGRAWLPLAQQVEAARTGGLSGGGRDGRGFCHGSCERDSSADRSGAERQRGDAERGGCGRGGDAARARGAEGASVAPAMGAPLRRHMSPHAAALAPGRGATLAEPPPHPGSASGRRGGPSAPAAPSAGPSAAQE